MVISRYLWCLFYLVCLLSINPSLVRADEPTACPPIPGIPGKWPYELRDPPYKDQAPAAQQQIIDTKRSHYAGPSSRPSDNNVPKGGASYCLYTPPSTAQGLILFLHGWEFGIEPGSYDPM